MRSKRIAATIIAALILCAGLATAQAATLSPTLKAQVAQLSGDTNLGIVIIAFKTDDGLKAAHLDLLRSVGITGGYTLEHLGMVGAVATVAQVRCQA